MSIRALLLACVLTCAGGTIATAGDWIFDNGPYTVNPQTGQRVEQYAQPKEPDRVPYKKFFSEDGDHPYIPYWYYWDQMGWPGEPGYIDVPYGGTGAGMGYPGVGWGWGGFQF